MNPQSQQGRPPACGIGQSTCSDTTGAGKTSLSPIATYGHGMPSARIAGLVVAKATAMHVSRWPPGEAIG